MKRSSGWLSDACAVRRRSRRSLSPATKYTRGPGWRAPSASFVGFDGVDQLSGRCGRLFCDFVAQLLALLAGDGARSVIALAPDIDLAAEQLLAVRDRLPAGIAKVAADRASASDVRFLTVDHQQRAGVVGRIVGVLVDGAVREADAREGRGTLVGEGGGVVLDELELAAVGDDACLDR